MGLEEWKVETLAKMVLDRARSLSKKTENSDQMCYWLGIRIAVHALTDESKIAQKAMLIAIIKEADKEMGYT